MIFLLCFCSYIERAASVSSSSREQAERGSYIAWPVQSDNRQGWIVLA
ncbi:MAG: hypothetical protein NTY29_09725 [Proteobacteria bacterium]|nr:hypothetical protein [Pseudomonadota bacterium]